MALVPGVLVDGVALAMRNVRTFKIPSVAERHGLRVGNVAKVMLRVRATHRRRAQFAGERVWYEVTAVHPGPRYVGRYMTDPPHVIDCPDILEFGPEHVIAWAEAPE